MTRRLRTKLAQCCSGRSPIPERHILLTWAIIDSGSWRKAENWKCFHLSSAPISQESLIADAKHAASQGDVSQLRHASQTGEDTWELWFAKPDSAQHLDCVLVVELIDPWGLEIGGIVDYSFRQHRIVGLPEAPDLILQPAKIAQ